MKPQKEIGFQSATTESLEVTTHDESIIPQNDLIENSFMLNDLARSTLVPEDMEATELPPSGFFNVSLGYKIPYYYRDGIPHETKYRVRLAQPKIDGRGHKQKYDQPQTKKIGNAARFPYFPPGRLALPKTGIVEGHEGEKRAALSVKLGNRAFAIGGAYNWNVAKGSADVHPEILAEIKDALDGIDSGVVLLWPDADILDPTKNVATGWCRFADGLERAGYKVKLMSLHKYGHAYDDVIAEHGQEILTHAEELSRDLFKPTVENLLKLCPALHFKLSGVGESQHKFIPATISNIMVLFETHPQFRGRIKFNQEQLCIELDGESFDDLRIPTTLLRVEIESLGFNGTHNKPSTADVKDAYVTTAHANTIEPTADWLRGLKWDGVGRIDSWLSIACGADGNDQFVRDASARFLIGAVARRLNPGCYMRWMLILQGIQKLGKSGIPAALFGRENTSILNSTNNIGKDPALVRNSTWCVNFDELATYRTAKDMEELKSMISNPQDAVRIPYGVGMITTQRRVVLFGSANDKHFLRLDPSGNNRYVVIETHPVVGDEFNFEWLAHNREQLFAEAVVRYQAGEKFDSVDGANERATQYEDTTLREAIMDTLRVEGCISSVCLQWPKACRDMGGDVVFLKSSQLRALYLASSKSNIGQAAFNSTLVAMGFREDLNGLKTHDGFHSTGRGMRINLDTFTEMVGIGKLSIPKPRPLAGEKPASTEGKLLKAV
jgi:hypothetical protein